MDQKGNIHQNFRQVCVLSPILFNLFICDVGKALSALNLDTPLFCGDPIPIHLCAEDAVLLACMEVAMHKFLAGF